MIEKIRKDLQKVAKIEKVKTFSSFFKTDKGQYSDGDIFIGVSVPDSREIAKNYVNIDLIDLKKILYSKIHEERLTALLILVEKFKSENKNNVFNFYVKNIGQVNNWDLVDLTADKIIGSYLIDKDKSMLYTLAKSNNLWKKRIAIVSTFFFIKNKKFEDTLKIAKILLKDKHDLIHKAVGWMLREVGKRNLKVEENFLKKYHKEMPRTMLRYAIERFDNNKKKFYLE